MSLYKSRVEKIKEFIRKNYNAELKKVVIVNREEFYEAVLKIKNRERVLEIYFEDNSDKIKSVRFVDRDVDIEDLFAKKMLEAESES